MKNRAHPGPERVQITGATRPLSDTRPDMLFTQPFLGLSHNSALDRLSCQY